MVLQRPRGRAVGHRGGPRAHPEAIAFSIIAGVDPKVGLYASVLIAVVTAFAGGRPAQISAATGAMALVMVDLVRVHGLDHLFAASVLAGVVQIACGRLKLGRYIRFVPHTVMLGFVNALAILIFLAQLPQFVGATWEMYALVAAGLAIIYAVPRVTKAVPSPLVAIVVLSTVAIVAGLFGGMAGCAMIGQSVINVRSGGRTRLSTLCAGVFLLFFMLVLGGWVSRIPMAALVAVMFTVSISTFSWRSVATLHRVPRTEALVMVATVGTVVLTHDLARGVLVGVLLSAFFFARKVATLVAVGRDLDAAGELRVYRVSGQLFFASVSDFLGAFDFAEPVRRVELDLTHAHVWDGSVVGAIDQVVLRFCRRGVPVHLLGLNAASATLLDQLAVHHKAATAPPAHHPA